MTRRTLRSAVTVAASGMVVLGLAACGGGAVTKSDSTKAASSSSAASEKTSSSAAPSESGSSSESASSEAGGTEVGKATEADIDPAKQVVVDFVNDVADGKGEAACQLVYATQVGGVPTGKNLKDCATGIESQSEKFKSVKSTFSKDSMDGKLTSEGKIELKNKAGGKSMTILKTKDGKLLIDGDKF